MTDGKKENVELKKNIDEVQFVGSKNEGIRITDADSVYLITISDRDYDMGKYDAFDSRESFALIDLLANKAKAIADKYSENGSFDYDTALKNHLAVYQPQFDAVTINLEDSDKSNEALLKEQKGKKNINLALAQRTYYAGRYAYLCCSG